MSPWLIQTVSSGAIPSKSGDSATVCSVAAPYSRRVCSTEPPACLAISWCPKQKPRTGTPRSSRSRVQPASSSRALSAGDPERMIPRYPRYDSSGSSGSRISADTPSPRTFVAIRCTYCPPKSSTAIAAFCGIPPPRSSGRQNPLRKSQRIPPIGHPTTYSPWGAGAESPCRAPRPASLCDASARFASRLPNAPRNRRVGARGARSKRPGKGSRPRLPTVGTWTLRPAIRRRFVWRGPARGTRGGVRDGAPRAPPRAHFARGGQARREPRGGDAPASPDPTPAGSACGPPRMRNALVQSISR